MFSEVFEPVISDHFSCYFKNELNPNRHDFSTLIYYLLICVLVFTVFCIACTSFFVLFLLCVYVLIVLSVLTQSDNSEIIIIVIIIIIIYALNYQPLGRRDRELPRKRCQRVDAGTDQKN
jgi:hypothetical protein